MNIIFTRFPLESVQGGAEVQTLSLMKGLTERGHKVMFLGSCPTLLQECRTKNVECRALNIGAPPVTKWGAVIFLWRRRAMRKKLLEAVRAPHPIPLPRGEGKLDAICMLSLSEKLLLTPWAIQQGISVFWIEHDRIGRWLQWNLWLPHLRSLSKKVTTIVVSELSRKMYLNLGWPPQQTITIPNGVNIGQVSTPSPLPSPQGGGNILHIGCVARLTPDKGVDLLIDAIADIPDTKLTILGRGPEEGYLRKLITERNLTNHVQMKSWINEIADFYSSIDILILPSREHDPFGLVAAEAMSFGIPVVVTDACGIAGYLQDGVNAVIVPENSASALKEAIQRMSNVEYRMSIARAGQKTAQEKFSLEKMIDAYEQVLHSPLP